MPAVLMHLNNFFIMRIIYFSYVVRQSQPRYLAGSIASTSHNLNPSTGEDYEAFLLESTALIRVLNFYVARELLFRNPIADM